MRPTYETAQDITREEGVARTLAKASGKTAHKLPKFYPCDWGLTDTSGRVTTLLEIKCRNVKHDQYPTFMLSLHKWTALRSFTEHANVYVIVRYTDGIFKIPVTPGTWEVRMGGRTDRGDSQDTEPVIHVPIDKMQRIQ